MNTGTIKQIVGPVVDVYFEHDLPEIQHALTVEWIGENKDKRKITLEVAQHLGLGRVRAIALDSTDGLRRDTEVKSTGAPVMVPVGEKFLDDFLMYSARRSMAG
jgi:F-type H+-transporting ATPase subunit beta